MINAYVTAPNKHTIIIIILIVVCSALSETVTKLK